ncbi:hypothetical protein BD560DRAFT_409517 [Blakeslea trispora]|nr:hypothetical protein BD560DRAFT_409517 [Blakeslea trispora]
MLKQSYRSNYHCYTAPSRTSHGKHSSHLYDRARQDTFDHSNSYEHHATVPSITTICLLQIQANIIQVMAYLPYHDKAVLKQCLRWVLVIGLLFLDTIARMLGVDQEMKELKKRKKQQEEDSEAKATVQPSRLADDEYVYYHGQCTTQPSISEQPLSERTSPTLVKRTQHLVTPGSPIPTSFFPKTISVHHGSRKAHTQPPSPITPTPSISMEVHGMLGVPPSSSSEERKSIDKTTHHVGRSSRASWTPSHGRSLSNTMIDRGSMSPQKLRRVTGQREITVQNAISPRPSISTTTTTTKHHHDTKAMASSSGRSESSESSATLSAHNQRPKMQKTSSLSTAQQYHKQVEYKSSRLSLNESTQKPYERCCPACATN